MIDNKIVPKDSYVDFKFEEFLRNDMPIDRDERMKIILQQNKTSGTGGSGDMNGPRTFESDEEVPDEIDSEAKNLVSKSEDKFSYRNAVDSGIKPNRPNPKSSTQTPNKRK